MKNLIHSETLMRMNPNQVLNLNHSKLIQALVDLNRFVFNKTQFGFNRIGLQRIHIK